MSFIKNIGNQIVSTIQDVASKGFRGATNYVRSTDCIILPFPDVATPSLKNVVFGRVSTLLKILRGIRLNAVLQLEADKGNVLTAHRVDGGYALTQRGGNNDDRVFVRFILLGRDRFAMRELIASLANEKDVPLAFFSKETIILKAQIESMKTIVTTDRRQAMIVHLVLRQLRSSETNLVTTTLRAVGGLISGRLLESEDIYSAQNRYTGSTGASLLGIDLLSGLGSLVGL